MSPDGRENIVKYAQKLCELRSSEERASEEAEIVELLSKNDIINEKNVALTKDIAEIFNKSRGEKEKWKTKSVGWLIRKLGFNKVHTGQGNGWLIYKERLGYLQQIYGITENTSLSSQEKVQNIQKAQPLQAEATQNQCSDCRNVLNDNVPSTFYKSLPLCMSCYHKMKAQEKSS